MTALFGIIGGGIAGYFYRRFFGCGQNCSIYRNNFSSVIYGAMIGLLFLTSACSPEKDEPAKPSEPQVAEIKSEGHELDNTAFAEKMLIPGVVILDVRTPSEFESGHLVNAINLNFNSAEFNSDVSKLNKDDTYLIYCKSGMRSEKAYQDMSHSGFNSLFTLHGGIVGWKGEIVR